MRKRILSMILTLSLVITLLPVGTLTASAADPVYDGNYSYVYRITGSRSNTLGIPIPGVYLIEDATITTTSIGTPAISIDSNGATLVIKGNVTLQGANGNGISGGGAGILVPSGYSVNIVGYAGTTNSLTVKGGNGGNAANGANGGSASTDESGAGGEGGTGGGGGGAAIGTNGGNGYTNSSPNVSSLPCGSVGIDTSNLSLNLVPGGPGSAGSGGNGGSSNGWSVLAAAARAGGGGGGGGGAGYRGQPIGTGGQGGFKGAYGGNGASDTSGACYAGGGGGGAGGNGSTRGGGGGGGGRALAYVLGQGLYTETGARGGAPGCDGSCYSDDGYNGSEGDDGYYFNGYGGSGMYGGAGGSTPSSGVPGNEGASTNNISEYYTSYKTIWFNANGGSASSFTMVTGNTVSSLPANNPTRTDYTFKGWATSKTATTPNVSATSTLGSTATTFYAVWERDTYDAVITVKQNGNIWMSSVDSTQVILSTSSTSPDTGKVTGTLSDGIFTFSEIDPSNTMYVWAKNSIGEYVQKGSVSASSTTATVDYYYVYLNRGTGIASVTGSKAYLSGETAKISATLSSGYTWSKWSDNNTTMTDRVITVDKSYDLTANAVAIPATAPTVGTTGTTLTYGYTSGSISVTATPAAGHTITGYQWYSCGGDGSNKATVSGATSVTYNIPTGKDVGLYYYVCDVTTQRTDNSQTKTITTSPATLVTINKSPITVVMNDITRVFGSSNPPFNVKIIEGELKNNEAISALLVTGATTATQNSNVGTYDITGTSTSTNYDVTIIKGTLKINKKTPASSDFNYDLSSKTYNGNAQGVTVTPKSGTASITVYYEGVSPTSYTKSTTPPNVPGTYKLSIDVSSATNYSDKSNLTLGNYIINEADVGSITLTSSKYPSTFEEEVTFTATVTKAGNGATPTGTVVFKNGGTTLATVALSNGIAILKKSDLGAATNSITAEYGGDSNYNPKTSNTVNQTVNKKAVVIAVENTEFFYESGIERNISIKDTGTLLTANDFTVKYYLVDENYGELAKTTPVIKAISAGKYLYVIDFKNSQANYSIEKKFTVSDATLPDISNFDNIGYLDIKAAQSGQQKPISFIDGAVSAYITDSTYKNTLANENASTISYRSSNDDIAAVAADGTVTLKKAGTVTITATSELQNTTPVYASYVLTINKKSVTITAANDSVGFGTAWDKSTTATYPDGLSASDFTGTLDFDTNYTSGSKVGEYSITPKGLTSEKYEINFVSAKLYVTPKTLTKSDFKVTASDKAYDGTDKVSINAAIISGLYGTNSVKAEIEGSFTSVNASDNANVSYTIIGLTGKDADNYVLDDGSITGTVAAKIEKAAVSIICASTTTKTFDGNVQTVDVSAMANGNIFDSSNYTVKYDGKDSVSNVGTYPVTVVLNDNVKANYTVKPFSATLTIKEAVQDVFSIENVPDRVYYGDKFKVSTQGANGTVTYSLNQNAPATIDTDTEGNVSIVGTGSVTITATSTKEGYTPKTATKTFTAYQRVLIPTATATDRVYNAQRGVDVTIGLENSLATDNITATGSGVMANADAGTDKIVYVTGIKLEGSNKDFYTLSNTTLQTSVNIDKATVTDFTILADIKKYDGTNVATATVDSINGIYDSDKGQVNVIGSAMFNDELSGTGKIVTFTAYDLSGAKAMNYKFANDSVKTATKTADITPINVNFTVGTATFKYDGDKKEVAVSGVDEFGRVFSDYTVQYLKDSIQLSDIPNEAGDYTVKVVLNDNTNYTATLQDISMVIAQASQEQITIVGLPGAIEYTDKFTLEAIGGSGTGYVEWTSDNSNVTVDSDGNVSIDGAVNEKVTITATKKDDTNYTEKSAKVVFIPTTKTISFTLDDLSQTYDENDKEISVTPSISNATYDVKYNGLSELPVNAGTYNVVVTANGNYKGAANTTLTIGKAKMNGLSVSQNGCTYGVDLVDATFDTAPNGVDVSVKYSTLDGKKPTKVGDYIVTATYTGDNYETFAASSEFKIEKKILTVKASDKTRKYGEANPVFTLIYDGFVNNENASGLLSEPIATTVATASSPVNDYEITVSGGRADNYSFNYDNTGKLKVTGAVGGNFYITGSNNSVTVGDLFTLHAYYDNAQPKVKWVSSDSTVASVDENGSVKILKKGDATITATITDTNYESGISATFKLNASKKAILIKPADLVKVYNAQRQDITLVSDDANFIPKLSGENKNIDITYTLTTDSSVTEPKQAGVYTVTYSINHPSYTGGDTVTMYINKANVTVTAHDLTKVYGEANPAYYITGLIGADETDANYIAKIAGLFNITSDADATGTKANAGEYPIALALKEGKSLNDDLNYNLVISDAKGSLTVTKAPLKIKVSDAQRAYSEDNKNPEYEYVGLVNGETEADLTNKPVFTYDASIRKETNVGTYPDIITASGAASGNYEISYSYADGNKANLIITALPVKLSVGTSKSGNLTVNLDKAIAGLTKNNFKVTLNGATVEIISVTANHKNTVYTLNGSFKTGSTYAVEVNAYNYLFEGSPISITPTASSSGGGGVGNVVTDTYKITVTQATGGKISPETVNINGSKTFAISPNEGYEIEDVLVNGKSVGKVNEYTFEQITSAGTITAKFKKIEAEKPVDPIDPALSEWKNPFNDVNEKDWFYEAIKFVNEKGFMMGTTSSVFEPKGDVTRAMFVTVLYRIENEPDANTALFNDLENGAYYEKAVSWASENGIVKGISETQFAPNKDITREQMAVIVYRYAMFKGVDISVSDKTDYTDNASISDYAKDAVVWASNNGIMTGNTNGSFAPQDNSTRAETAVVLKRFIEMILNNK